MGGMQISATSIVLSTLDDRAPLAAASAERVQQLHRKRRGRLFWLLRVIPWN